MRAAGLVMGSAACLGLLTAATSGARPLGSVVIADLGGGYRVLSQGPLKSAQIATSAPDPTNVDAALRQLSHTGSIATYQRVWQDTDRDNEVQDLLVRFTTVSAAQVFSSAVQHSLTSGEIVSSGPLRGIPRAIRTTYFAISAGQVGVGQAIAFRSGLYVATLSTFSSNAVTDTDPISATRAGQIATAQFGAIMSAVAGAAVVVTAAPSSTAWGWIVLAVAVVLLLAAALAFWLFRRRTVDAIPAEGPANVETASQLIATEFDSEATEAPAPAPVETPIGATAAVEVPSRTEPALTVIPAQVEAGGPAPEFMPPVDHKTASRSRNRIILAAAAAILGAAVVVWLLRRRSAR
ncbi:MAG TPA: hypothetical protein VG298_03980 [Acidimicrobiales bacterium]|nr:hypothetical protein [Acidimicrobiales bacterium]